MESRKPSDNAERIVVRLPDGIRDRLAHRAKANGRSSNSETIFALKMWLDQADWIDAKIRGEEVGPWPGIVPETLPQDLRIKILFAANRQKRSADEEIAARLQSSFGKTTEEVRPPNELLRVVDGKEWLADILGKAMLDIISHPRLLEDIERRRYEEQSLIDEVGRVFDAVDLPLEDSDAERHFGGPPSTTTRSRSKEERRLPARAKRHNLSK